MFACRCAPLPLPSLRYLATIVTQVQQMENGFNVWSFSGKLLYQLPRDRFLQVR